ncbi:MAG: DUF2764 domain-containing protein [Bacteroidales bacterium]|nr:DUF2764 domain-containing protein [Bacteroidales bacterium]
MNNYEYIIACLPILNYGDPQKELPDAFAIAEAIKNQCSVKDGKLIDFLRSGFNPEQMDEDFYLKAISHDNSFIRGYFSYDLSVRNAKVDFINRSLGRPSDTDIVLSEYRENEQFDDACLVNSILENPDILSRERGLDELMWKRIDELTKLNFLDINTILAFIAKLQIVGRWLRLNEETGRELFRQFVRDIRQTYDNKKNSI